MISYNSRRNGDVTLNDFGFGESNLGNSPLTSHTNTLPKSFGDEKALVTTLKPKSSLCSEEVTPPTVVRKSAMYQAVMAACLKVGRRLPTFEYADIIVELERVDWRASDGTITRIIRVLRQEGKLKRYGRGVYSL